MGCGNSACSGVTKATIVAPGDSEASKGPAPPRSPGQSEVGVERTTSFSDSQRRFHEDYTVGAKLGKGSFATVHLVRKIGSSEKLAVKVIDLRDHKNNGGFDGPIDPKRRQAAVKEIKMLQAVDGREHVIHMVDAFIENTLSFIVLEKCELTLLQVLERIPELTESSIKRVFFEMLKGLAATHAGGVVHRDVKPDNFLCTGESATVKLCDYGLAAKTGTSRSCLGLAGIYGTPPFMAPEMLQGALYGPKVDTWSFGVIVYALLFGQFPYKPLDQTGPAMKAAISAGCPAPNFTVKHGLEGLDNVARISPVANELVHKLLNRSAEERPSAEQALECSFFRMVPNPEKQTGSLRPMLFASKRMGAFDVRASKPQTTAVDLRLAELQDTRAGAAGTSGGNVQPSLSSGKAGAAQRHPASTEPSSRKQKAPWSDTSTDVGSIVQSDCGTTENSSAMA